MTGCSTHKSARCTGWESHWRIHGDEEERPVPHHMPCAIATRSLRRPSSGSVSRPPPHLVITNLTIRNQVTRLPLNQISQKELKKTVES